MGYHISIQRDPSVSEEEFRTASEWIGAERLTDDGKTAEFKISTGPLFVFWKDGEVWTKNPDEEAIGTLYKLSAKLGGRLVGDEGETYRKDGSSFISPKDEEEQAHWRRETAKGLENRKIWSVLQILLILIVVIIVILNKCVVTK